MSGHNQLDLDYDPQTTVYRLWEERQEEYAERGVPGVPEYELVEEVDASRPEVAVVIAKDLFEDGWLHIEMAPPEPGVDGYRDGQDARFYRPG